MTNRLYYGDNLEILRKEIKDESVDLIYLDPPFNSKRDYNLLFKTPKGQQSDAQITAFEDSWHWGPQAEREFYELQTQANTDVAQMMQALRDFLGTNDMMAYLTMMANRLLEMQRVLKPTGSLYLHCDPTASHYLKIVLDGVFGKENFRADIVWKRTNARGTEGRWPRLHDSIFHYSKTNTFCFNSLKVKADKAKLPHTLVTGPNGSKYQSFELTGPGITKEGESGKPWRGFDPARYGRHWGNSPAQMEEWDKRGLIHWPKDRGFPRRRADEPFNPEDRTVTVGDVWVDIDRINQSADERLGYPTQKPQALLERIIQASSNEGDIVLDPFCGCGTAVHAAEKLKRRWIGIDITHLAISLIEKRMKKAFPYLEAVAPGSRKAQQAGPNAFEVIGVPHHLDAARDLAARDKHQFQLWAVSLVGAQPYRGGVKGSDKGIDGLIFPEVGKAKTEKVVVSVKGGENVGAVMVRDLKGVLAREKAVIGLFVTLALPTKEMIKEAASAGMYESPHHGAFPKLQILTIEGLLSGKERAQYPDMAMGGQTFKHAKTENKKTDQQKLF